MGLIFLGLTGAAAIFAFIMMILLVLAVGIGLCLLCVSIFEYLDFVHPLISGLLLVADRAENTAQLAPIQRASS